jgi:hypothetical protein
VHPTLTEVIGRSSPGYASRIDSLDIVGRGRPWWDGPDVAARPEERRCRFVDDPRADAIPSPAG